MDSFQMACGLAGLLTLELEGPGLPSRDRRIFASPSVLIGRDDRADLVLDHDKVSRRHAFLQVLEGRVFFIDLDSRTGTSRGGKPLESGWLPPGEALGVGPYRLRASVDAATPPSSEGGEGDPPNPLLARSSASLAGLPKVSLEFQSRTAGHSIWRMSQVVALVGSSPRCKVRLLDSNVSKLHCALIRTARGLWVVDLLSREGITVNGLSVRSARLRPSDVLGLGHVVVRANFEDATPQPGPAPPGAWGAPAGGFSFGAGLPVRQAPWPPSAGLPPIPGLPPDAFPGGADTPALPVDPAAPPIPASAAQEPALAMLLSHFGTMQQQMLDQFQQSMFMMLQMFSGMHREQMGVMREELERLRELNVEMAAIKAEMANRQARVPVPFPMPAPSGRPVNGRHAAGPQPAADPPPPTGADPSRRIPDPTAQAPPAAPTPPLEPSADVHDWLNDRLTAITTEQQNRWQRIMSLMRGDK